MFDFVFVIAAVLVVAAPIAAFMSFCEWAHEENRVPFFWKWYLDWSRKEGLRRAAAAKSRR